MKRLKGNIIQVRDLNSCQKNRMFELMDMHFEGMNENDFNRDLHEKQWVINLTECDFSKIQGFSTFKLIDDCVEGINVKAIFSGDTIIHKDYWGETELARTFGKFITRLVHKYEGTKLYWFLISMGYRTYLFLPLFFKDFYPSYNKPTPEFENKVITAFACREYPSKYDSKTGIIHPASYHLRLDIANIAKSKSKNPHVKFFIEKNPSYTKGDELACIAELSEKNFTKAARKMLGAT